MPLQTLDPLTMDFIEQQLISITPLLGAARSAKIRNDHVYDTYCLTFQFGLLTSIDYL